MARFDVFQHPEAAARRTTPFLLDVQNEFISGIETRVVVPMRNAARLKLRLRDLHPEFEVGGVLVVMDTPALAAIPARELGSRVATLGERRADIVAALDCLFGAY